MQSHREELRLDLKKKNTANTRENEVSYDFGSLGGNLSWFLKPQATAGGRGVECKVFIHSLTPTSPVSFQSIF